LMKLKLHRILGIGLTVALVLSLGIALSAAPAAAEEDEWSKYALPEEGADGDYIFDSTINDGPLALTRDIDDHFWASVDINLTNEIVRSLDTEGRAWETTDYSVDIGGDIILDIVCSPLDADVAYACDVNAVYKTEDGGDSWDEVGDFDTDVGGAISCLTVGWDEDDDPRCFVACRDNAVGDDDGSDTGETDGIWYLYDVPFGDDWTSLELDVGSDAGLDQDLTVWGISVSPNFAEDAYQAALVADTDESETFLVSHEGSNPGGWTIVEINDDLGADMEAIWGSDPAFPDDWTGPAWEAESTELFVGIMGPLHNLNEGGVVRVYGNDAGDYEILDDIDDDIISLDIVGSLGNTQMLAGEHDDPDVWYSWDDGDNWESATAEGISPAGAGPVFVYIDADFDEDTGIGWAATLKDSDGGIHRTIDGGTRWLGISLLNDDIDEINGAAFLTDYPGTVLLATEDSDNDTDVWRYDSADDAWERIYESQLYGTDVDLIDAIGNTVLIAEAGASNILYSDDLGQSFAEPDEEPGDDIISLLLLDDETWWVGDTNGDLWITDDAGDRSWDEYEIDGVSDITSLAVRGDEAIAGVSDGADSDVYYSEDAGETWDMVGDLSNQTSIDNEIYVCFDEGNDNPDVIYAACEEVIARFQYLTTDLDEDWEIFDVDIDGDGNDDFDDASGIACMDGVLYASDSVAVDVTAPTFGGGVMRCVNPLQDLDDVDESDLDHVVAGLTEGGDPLDGGLLVTSGSNNLWGIEIAGATLWTYEDLMVVPVTDMEVNPDDTDATITWDGFDNATDYELWIYSNEGMTPAYEVYTEEIGGDEAVAIIDGTTPPFGDINALTPGTQYWCQVRASEPVHSKWSTVFTFNDDPGAIGVDEDTLAPKLGAMNVPITTPFSWGFDEDADSYYIEISDTADFSNILDSATVGVPAYESSIILNEGTSYWFRVQAIASGQGGNFAYSSFTTTIPDEIAPTPPATATPSTPTPVEIVQETITPNYIYAIIGIGIGLAVAVGVILRKKTR